ncbi:hypothetical protein [Embleya sp. NPDC005971]|uniref:hypothetical protein n=1 Tax=Embleya sp. NPDC005971 TaxID=3156724 RepID=UPI0033EC5623
MGQDQDRTPISAADADAGTRAREILHAIVSVYSALAGRARSAGDIAEAERLTAERRPYTVELRRLDVREQDDVRRIIDTYPSRLAELERELSA